MKLEEAIRIETIHNEHNPAITDQERCQAHAILIEAGKREQYYRWLNSPLSSTLLPGESGE